MSGEAPRCTIYLWPSPKWQLQSRGNGGIQNGRLRETRAVGKEKRSSVEDRERALGLGAKGGKISLIMGEKTYTQDSSHRQSCCGSTFQENLKRLL